MVNAAECRWTKEQAKALIAFLIAEKRRHLRDISLIEQNIKKLREEHKLTDEEMRECGEKALLFVYF